MKRTPLTRVDVPEYSLNLLPAYCELLLQLAPVTTKNRHKRLRRANTKLTGIS